MNERRKQLGRAISMMDRGGLIARLTIPGRGTFMAYRYQVEIFEAIHGKENVTEIAKERACRKGRSK